MSGEVPGRAPADAAVCSRDALSAPGGRDKLGGGGERGEDGIEVSKRNLRLKVSNFFLTSAEISPRDSYGLRHCLKIE